MIAPKLEHRDAGINQKDFDSKKITFRGRYENIFLLILKPEFGHNDAAAYIVRAVLTVVHLLGFSLSEELQDRLTQSNEASFEKSRYK